MKILQSTKHPQWAAYTDAEIVRMLQSAENQREEIMVLYDAFEATETDIDTIDAMIFALEDECCARNI